MKPVISLTPSAENHIKTVLQQHQARCLEISVNGKAVTVSVILLI